MAKSYVTQFTEYVSEQQDSLRNKLKAKGLSPSPNATLGSLVSDLDSLQESFGTEKYTRDPNFPDIDTMFDNDPLRVVNGGQYAGCVYLIQLVDSTNNSASFYKNNFPTEKIIFSDGVEYDNVTSSFVHAIQENGIFVGEDGYKYCLIRLYSSTALTSTVSSIQYGVIEIIDDFTKTIGNSSGNLTQAAVSGYTNIACSLQYVRFPCSNCTTENYQTVRIFDYSNATAVYSAYIGRSLKCVRVDGFCKLASVKGALCLEKLVINGSLVGSTTFQLGQQVNFGVYSSYMDYVKAPSGVDTFNCYSYVKTVYLPDTLKQFTPQGTNGSNYFCSPSTYIENLHIGNGLTSAFGTSVYANYWYSLKNVTISPNAWGLNESAITIDFSQAYSLTKQSVLNLFNGVADRTGMTANIMKLPAHIKAYLTDEEKAILTNKNWTLS